MNEFEVRKRLAEIRAKAEKEADFDDDGDVDAEDFLKTKKGRRAMLIAAAVVFILLAIAFGKPAAAAGEIEIPVDCGQAVCVLPKDAWQAILKAHNGQVDEIAKLRAQLGGKVRLCPGEKES